MSLSWALWVSGMKAQATPLVCGSRRSNGCVPGWRRIQISGACGLDLEGVPLRLPAFGGMRPLKVKVSSTLVAVTSWASSTKPAMPS
jgi:hypothetical protein